MRSSTTTTTSSDHEEVRLNNGITMPVLGMGTYSWDNHKQTTQSVVHMALQMGYRHFDTAKIYGSEAALGNALNQAFQLDDGGGESTVIGSSMDRDDVFVTSKLWGSDHHDPVSALRQSLKKLGMEYLDMYLVHWPVKLKPWNCEAVPKEEDFEVLDLESTWNGMQRCLDLELCRSIGVSNFSSNKILHLLDLANVPPAVNQVEMHPMWRQNKLREVCAENKIHVRAYSPLGAPGSDWGTTSVVQNPIIKSIATKHNATLHYFYPHNGEFLALDTWTLPSRDLMDLKSNPDCRILAPLQDYPTGSTNHLTPPFPIQIDPVSNATSKPTLNLPKPQTHQQRPVFFSESEYNRGYLHARGTWSAQGSHQN